MNKSFPIKSIRTLRFFINVRMKSGLSEMNARSLVASLYPYQSNEIWTLDLKGSG